MQKALYYITRKWSTIQVKNCAFICTFALAKLMENKKRYTDYVGARVVKDQLRDKNAPLNIGRVYGEEKWQERPQQRRKGRNASKSWQEREQACRIKILYSLL